MFANTIITASNCILMCVSKHILEPAQRRIIKLSRLSIGRLAATIVVDLLCVFSPYTNCQRHLMHLCNCRANVDPSDTHRQTCWSMHYKWVCYSEYLRHACEWIIQCFHTERYVCRLTFTHLPCIFSCLPTQFVPLVSNDHPRDTIKSFHVSVVLPKFASQSPHQIISIIHIDIDVFLGKVQDKALEAFLVIVVSLIFFS